MASASGHTSGFGLSEAISTAQFIVMMTIVYFAGRKMVKEGLKSRAESISKKIIDAKLELEKIQFEAQKAKNEISKISETKQQMIAEVKLEGQKFYDQLVGEAKETAARILADSKLAANNEVSQAALKLKQEIVSQAVEAALKMSESAENKSVIHKGLVEQLTISGASSKLETTNGIA
jgi:F0F1-type ATP synthase membrane subunit b/b'